MARSDADFSARMDGRGPMPPSRFSRPHPLMFALLVFAAGFFVVSLRQTGWSTGELVRGLPYMWNLVQEMFPPDVGRLHQVGWALLETFQMALVGTVFGVAASVFFAVLATRRLTPHWTLYAFSRGVIALFRTVPDLVWALIFVATVGLGPFAGTLTILVDTIGFCGRFFAEAMEETDPGPQEALTALGASRWGVIGCAVFPGAMPSFVASSLFSLEKATRSSVVLGLVGAGGIGIELKVSMDMFRYAEASTIMLSILLLVMLVERVSSTVRRRIL